MKKRQNRWAGAGRRKKRISEKKKEIERDERAENRGGEKQKGEEKRVEKGGRRCRR